MRRDFGARPTLSTARAVIADLEGTGVQQRRVWFARSFTIEPVFPLLRAGALLEGLDLELRAGGFNAYSQEILDPRSPLYAFDPEVVVLAVQTRDLLPDLWDPSGAIESAALERQVEQTARSLGQLVATLRANSAASIVLFDFAKPVRPADGVLHDQVEESPGALIDSLNRALRAIAAASPGVFVLGYDALVARIGRERFYDERKWLTARMPIAAAHLWPVARECLRVLLPVTGMIRKAIVVDLDNTLWGGVVGEEGIDGIQIGNEYPGAAYRAVQKALLDHHRRGVILAVASKNNPDDALKVVDEHPGMLLRREHFSALQIGWQAKSRSVRDIAAELNIGTDAIVFVDDNPAEREEVRRELPEVLVVELPPDPMDFAAALRDIPSLERVRVSAEDRDRGRQYAEQRQRVALKGAAGTLEEYLRSLEMVVHIAPMSDATLARVSQLTQKTNQFNLTTRRYDEAALRALVAAGDGRIYCCSVRDRFGDNGLVGVAIVRVQGRSWEIDTLLLSCRVIGRTVETAMLSHLAAEARGAAAESLRGWFIPTAKNLPAADFYASHGLTPLLEREGATLWEMNLSTVSVGWPDWLGRPPGNGAP